MKEYRCRNCGQVFQMAEIPGEPLPDPVQCPACRDGHAEPLSAAVQDSRPREAPPGEPAIG